MATEEKQPDMKDADQAVEVFSAQIWKELTKAAEYHELADLVKDTEFLDEESECSTFQASFMRGLLKELADARRACKLLEKVHSSFFSHGNYRYNFFDMVMDLERRVGKAEEGRRALDLLDLAFKQLDDVRPDLGRSPDDLVARTRKVLHEHREMRALIRAKESERSSAWAEAEKHRNMVEVLNARIDLLEKNCAQVDEGLKRIKSAEALESEYEAKLKTANDRMFRVSAVAFKAQQDLEQLRKEVNDRKSEVSKAIESALAAYTKKDQKQTLPGLP